MTEGLRERATILTALVLALAACSSSSTVDDRPSTGRTTDREPAQDPVAAEDPDTPGEPPADPETPGVDTPPAGDPPAPPRLDVPPIAPVASCPMPSEEARDAVPLTLDVLYRTAGGEPLHLDFAYPNGEGPFPAVLVIHGGGWQVGLREHVHGMIRALALQGYVGVAVEYRLTRPPDENLFPAAVADARCAVRFLRDQAAAHRVDPARIGAIGYSAGGHLVAMLATAADVDGLDDGCAVRQSPAIEAAVAYFAPFELRDPAGFPHRRARRILADFLGGAPSDHPARAALASPLVHVTPDDAPMLVIQGTADVVVSVSQARTMRDALVAAHVPVSYLEIPGAEHGFTMLSSRPPLRAAGCTTMAFLDAALRPGVAAPEQIAPR